MKAEIEKKNSIKIKIRFQLKSNFIPHSIYLFIFLKFLYQMIHLTIHNNWGYHNNNIHSNQNIATALPFISLQYYNCFSIVATRCSLPSKFLKTASSIFCLNSYPLVISNLAPNNFGIRASPYCPKSSYISYNHGSG